MKKIIYLFIVCFVILAIHCCGYNNINNSSCNDKQEFFNNLTKSCVVDSSTGHEYILYEHGNIHSRYYSFSVEHSVSCKKCLDIFD